MTPRNSPTVWRRWLAAELKGLREAKGLHQKDVGRECGWSGARLSYLEHGQQVPTEDDLDQLLPLYAVAGDEVSRFYEAIKFAREKGWWERYDDRLVPDYLREFLGLEQGASVIRVIEPHVVPGLLQTRDYTTALLRSDVQARADRHVERIVELRLARQGVLTDPPLAVLEAVIDESVLRRVVGAPAVMAAQLEHLASVAVRPNVTLRVFPFARGVSEAMVAGFRILAFPNEVPAVLYLEHRSGAQYYDEPRTVDDHLVVFEHASSLALTAEESVALVAELANRYAAQDRESTL